MTERTRQFDLPTVYTHIHTQRTPPARHLRALERAKVQRRCREGGQGESRGGEEKRLVLSLASNGEQHLPPARGGLHNLRAGTPKGTTIRAGYDEAASPLARRTRSLEVRGSL